MKIILASILFILTASAAGAEERKSPPLRSGWGITHALRAGGCDRSWTAEAMRLNGVTEARLAFLREGRALLLPDCKGPAPEPIAAESRGILARDFARLQAVRLARSKTERPASRTAEAEIPPAREEALPAPEAPPAAPEPVRVPAAAPAALSSPALPLQAETFSWFPLFAFMAGLVVAAGGFKWLGRGRGPDIPLENRITFNEQTVRFPSSRYGPLPSDPGGPWILQCRCLACGKDDIPAHALYEHCETCEHFPDFMLREDRRMLT